MRIALASDHAGLTHRRAIGAHLLALGHQVDDFGTATDASCDYPDFAAPACHAVMAAKADAAVLVCGSGIGVSIVANKVPGMRCGLVHDVETARLAKQHNNAQAIALGARFVDIPTALAMVDAWMGATFEARHQRRLDKIAAVEGGGGRC